MFLKRIFLEQLSQAALIVAGLINSIFLTAVLLRDWGASTFETWSVCISLAGLVSLFEFGFNLYFNNHLMIEMEQGRLEAARRTYFVSNLIFAAGAISGLLIVSAIAFWVLPPEKYLNWHALLAAFILIAGGAARIAVCGTAALYRANRQYARLVQIVAAGEIMRAITALLVCTFGGDIITVAVAATVAATAIQVVFPIFDTRRRYIPHRAGFAFPRRGEVGQILSMSTAYFAQNVPLILLTSLPVITLGRWRLGAGLLTAFVLARTLSGLSRTVLQQFGISLGQECGRRLAVKDIDGTRVVFVESARLFSVLSGIAAGLLLAGGKEIMQIWTGNLEHFRFDYLVAATLPMALAPTSVLVHNVLAASNAPYLAAAGRWAQFLLTGLFAALLPIGDLGLRAMIALSLGEVLGYVPLAYAGVARLIPGVDKQFYFFELAVCMLTATLQGGATYGLLLVLHPTATWERCASLGLAAIVCAPLVLMLGIRKSYRRIIVYQILFRPFSRLMESVR